MTSPLLNVYLEKRAMLVRYFTARTRERGVAEDIVQELYLKISAQDEDYMVDNPSAFLFRAANNIWLNRMRGEGRDSRRNGQWHETTRQSMGDEVIVDEPDAEARLAARQQLELVIKGVDALPERTRDIFRLHRFEGLNQAEVAQRLGVSKSTVEKHLCAALKSLMALSKTGQGP
ncbi:sigma-70 family RNA polymerase sigma factor [Asticcacaulis sp. EMRT-3]|uniref:RNA polymerase sigma factor n=1 Tax=Asticcacaulis sp. EMRT-3 TaxID=3040349 RepID=UPI0024AF8AAB|nr:sigma-70 family RNA polymerase sigma factor [Asticcacaulis sp. EMRT-3]MDI7776257.1 sigma-70 family RNA polymerase sigma factor [Asticcacaulis sp. EMRT-3]